MTWKEHRTPAGRQIFRLRASAHRTSDSGCTGEPHGWPTPIVNDSQGSTHCYSNCDKDKIVLKLPGTAQLVTGCPTPNTDDRPSKNHGRNVGAVAETQVAGWATPQANDSELAGWGTPVSEPANGTPEAFLERKRKAIANGSSMGVVLSDLQMQAMAWCPTGWNTPRATDGSNGGPNQTGGALPADAATVSGPTTGSSTAATAKPAESLRLNPAFSLWLMGYPPEWMACGLRVSIASRSRRKSRTALDS